MQCTQNHILNLFSNTINQFLIQNLNLDKPGIYGVTLNCTRNKFKTTM